MAKKKKIQELKDQAESKSRKEEEISSLNFTRTNYMLFAASLLVIIIGWLALGKGSTNVAPVLLVLGYCVMIPASILWGIRKQGKKPDEDVGDSELPRSA